MIFGVEVGVLRLRGRWILELHEHRRSTPLVWVQGSDVWFYCSRFKVQGLEFGVWGLGFGAKSSCFRVLGLRFGV